ncbi:hypothetical protein KUCAC02_011760 [Chaenocephalus aceratus]|uniref:Uncharacterized protein n=1 Tax=Chaenocephalus aceratus TaxID=36190 RepID=A0ACB9WWT2_CHAAC|nr:hypothetical protein KUCAC02_011760 [Chaenocephalus aceratus]
MEATQEGSRRLLQVCCRGIEAWLVSQRQHMVTSLIHLLTIPCVFYISVVIYCLLL